MGVGRALVAACAFALVAGTGGSAIADDVDDLIVKMETAGTLRAWTKSAHLLTRTGDARAIPVFTDALDHKISWRRRTAAYALERLIDANTDQKLRAAAVFKLKAAGKKDGAARRAHAKITRGVVYVKFERFSDTAQVGRKVTAIATVKAKRAIRRAILNMESYSTATKTKPGYSVSGDVTTLTVDKSGSKAIVKCGVSVRVDRYPGSSVAGIIKSTSSVAAVKTRDAIQEAKADCVGAIASEGAKRAAKMIAPRAGSAKPAVATVNLNVRAGSEQSEPNAGADCRLGDAKECVATAREKLGFDEKLAAVLLEEGCNAGNIAGCVTLADGLRQDDASSEDEQNAAKLYEKACESDDPSACWKLGRLHMRGESVEQDLSEAKRLFKRACVLGSQAACDLTDSSAE